MRVKLGLNIKISKEDSKEPLKIRQERCNNNENNKCIQQRHIKTGKLNLSLEGLVRYGTQ